MHTIETKLAKEKKYINWYVLISFPNLFASYPFSLFSIETNDVLLDQADHRLAKISDDKLCVGSTEEMFLYWPSIQYRSKYREVLKLSYAELHYRVHLCGGSFRLG